MIEAVENHMPEVIVIDEIGTELEAQAARTIAERGVQLVGTAHGTSLENLMLNPTLSDLIGGIQSVTLGDEEARRRGSQKSILERKAPPTFDIVIEIESWKRVSLHKNVADTVDAMLRGHLANPETRQLSATGGWRSSTSRTGRDRASAGLLSGGGARSAPVGRTSTPPQRRARPRPPDSGMFEAAEPQCPHRADGERARHPHLSVRHPSQPARSGHPQQWTADRDGGRCWPG